MKFLCMVFGHRPEEGYYPDDKKGNCNNYFHVELDVKDGIGRQHARLYTKCRRCGRRYQVGMIHVPGWEGGGSEGKQAG